MNKVIRNHPAAMWFLNLAICIMLFLILMRVYTYPRIDRRIIEKYQIPVVEKLDTLINLYTDEREYRDTANRAVYRED
jgi:hypothetical protein